MVAPSANTTSGAWRWLCTTGFWRVPAGQITRKTLGDEMGMLGVCVPSGHKPNSLNRDQSYPILLLQAKASDTF